MRSLPDKVAMLKGPAKPTLHIYNRAKKWHIHIIVCLTDTLSCDAEAGKVKLNFGKITRQESAKTFLNIIARF